MAIDVLVVGAGAYVCGRKPGETGTVLPTLLALQQSGRVGLIRVACSRPESAAQGRERQREIESKLAYRGRVEWLPRDGAPDAHAYCAAASTAPRPAAAIVVVPDDQHFEVTSELLARGLHCLVVKPLAPTAAECRELARLARARGLLGEVEFHKRFDDANRILRRELRAGHLGELSFALVEYSQRASIPLETFRSWAAHSNPFQYLGVHYVDLIAWLSDATPLRASALGSKQLLASQGIDTYDAVQALVEWQRPSDGARFSSVFATSWIDPAASSAMSQQVIKLVGTRARIDSDQKRRGLEIAGPDRFDEINPYFSQWLPDWSGDGDRLRLEGYGPRSIEQFVADVECWSAGKPIRSPAARFEDAVVSSGVSEAVARSLAESGRWIEIESLGTAHLDTVRPLASAASARIGIASVHP